VQSNEYILSGSRFGINKVLNPRVWAKFWAGSKSRLTAVSLSWIQLGFWLRLWLRLTAQTHTSDHWLGLLTHRIGHWIAGFAAGLPDWCRLRLNNLVLIKRVYSQKRESLSNPLFFGITDWLSGRIHRHTLHFKCKWPSGLLFVFENRPSCSVARLHQWLCYILHALSQLLLFVFPVRGDNTHRLALYAD